MPILLMGYLFLGVYVTGEGISHITSDTSTLLTAVAIHLGGILFVVFAYYMGRKQSSGKFLGLSPVMWPVAAVLSYLVGIVAGCFI